MGDEKVLRRKSTTNLYKNMTVSKALAVLKISEREFRELSERDFRLVKSCFSVKLKVVILQNCIYKEKLYHIK